MSGIDSDRKCLFCLKTEPEVTFKKEAHIVPQSIGGEVLSMHECDICNSHFGRTLEGGYPSIDLAVKEIFYISKYMIVHNAKVYTDHRFKPMKKTTSYFSINFEKKKLSVKRSFKMKPELKPRLISQFRRGLWKIALQYLHIFYECGFDPSFQYIRDSLLETENDRLPVFYQRRRSGMILSNIQFVDTGQIVIFNDFIDVLKNFNVFEFELLGHVFALPLHPGREKLIQFFEYRKQSDFRFYFYDYTPMIEFESFDIQLQCFHTKESGLPSNMKAIDLMDRFMRLYPQGLFKKRA